MRKENKTQKIIGGIFLVVLMLGLVSAATNTSIMYAKNSSGAIAPLEMNDQGRLKVNLNLLNITASSIATVGNFSLGQKITFAFGEMIDNIQDGWIRVTGGLNVTSNFSLGGKLLSNDNGTLKWGGNDVSTNISILYAENSSGGVQTLQVADNGALKLEVGSVVSDIWEIVGGVTRLVAAGNVNLSNVLFVNSTSGRVGIGTASPTHALNVIGNANITGDLYLNSSSLYLGDKKISNEGGVISFDGQNITPTGMVVAFNLASCPTGWTEANGSNGTPDLRGIFIRGAGTNAITKMANGSFMTATYGQYYNDSFQGHEHAVYGETWLLGTGGSAGGDQWLDSQESHGTMDVITGPTTAGAAYGTPRTSGETAPASYALIYCVKTGSDTIDSSSIWSTLGDLIMPANDSMNFAINTSDFYVNVTSGNVGIGTGSPTSKLHVQTADAGGGIVAEANQDELTLEGSGNTGMTILSPSSNYGIIAFGDESDGLGGAFQYYNLNDQFQFYTNHSGGGTTAKMVINANGNVGIGTTSPGELLDIRLPTSTHGDIFGIGNTASGVYGFLGIQGTSPYRMYMGYGAGNEHLVIANGGNVGIGTTSPGYRLQVGQTSNYGWVAADGSWGTDSDLRLKTNIENITGALNIVNSLRGVRFDKINETNKSKQIGFIAQEIETQIPEMVSTGEDGMKGLSYSKITPVLVEAIKELSAENNALKQENSEIKQVLCEELGRMC